MWFLSRGSNWCVLSWESQTAHQKHPLPTLKMVVFWLQRWRDAKIIPIRSSLKMPQKFPPYPPGRMDQRSWRTGVFLGSRISPLANQPIRPHKDSHAQNCQPLEKTRIKFTIMLWISIYETFQYPQKRVIWNPNFYHEAHPRWSFETDWPQKVKHPWLNAFNAIQRGKETRWKDSVRYSVNRRGLWTWWSDQQSTSMSGD